jgi:putative ABC transport system permease protein
MSADFLEIVDMAFRTLNGNKLRSSLTMIGIIIGNASVIAIVSLGQGAQKYVNSEFEALGTNALFVMPGVDQTGPQSGATQANTLVLGDAEAIAREVPSIMAVAPEKSDRLRVTRGSQETQVTITGTTEHYLKVNRAGLAQGRFFGALDVQANNRVAVLGSTVSKTLFGTQNPLGKKIRVKNLSFRVIGVLKARGASLGQNRDELVLIPLTILANELAGKSEISRSPKIDFISVSAQDEQDSSAAQYQITNLLRLRHNILRGENDFTVSSQKDLMQSANNITNILILVLGATAGISLLVGGIGIMNIMLVSVTERTQEIGLRKAIGAKRADILIQFTIEAVVLSTVGGLLGIGLGVGTTLLVSAVSPLGVVISPGAIAIAVGVSGAIGVIFGVMPARRAAQLDPIVALRGSTE